MSNVYMPVSISVYVFIYIHTHIYIYITRIYTYIHGFFAKASMRFCESAAFEASEVVQTCRPLGQTNFFPMQSVISTACIWSHGWCSLTGPTYEGQTPLPRTWQNFKLPEKCVDSYQLAKRGSCNAELWRRSFELNELKPWSEAQRNGSDLDFM